MSIQRNQAGPMCFLREPDGAHRRKGESFGRARACMPANEVDSRGARALHGFGCRGGEKTHALGGEAAHARVLHRIAVTDECVAGWVEGAENGEQV